MNFLKQSVLFSVLCILIQIVPFPILHAHAQTNHEVDDEIVQSIRSQKSELLMMSTTLQSTEAPMYDRSTETIQEFSFVNKTFATDVGQPILLRFTSKLPADEVLIRIPSEGEVLATHLYDGASLQHSHGEYWTFRTQTKQTQFDLPVVFSTSGKYFVTIDHDAAYFYLEVSDVKESAQSEGGEISEEVEANNQGNSQINDVVEHYLYISEDLLALEEARILEETRDPQNRSTSNVSSWSQFRSAWNSSSTTVINFTGFSITNFMTASSTSLSARSSSVILNGPYISFQNHGHSLIMNGSATLQINGGVVQDSPAIIGRDSRTSPIIVHNGSGSIEIYGTDVNMGTGTATSVISGQNIVLGHQVMIYSWMNEYTSASVRASGVEISRGGTLEIQATSSITQGFISGTQGVQVKPISSDANSTIVIQSNRFSMGEYRASWMEALNSWNMVDVTLGGLNGQTVINSNSDPNDFSDRYAFTFNDPRYNVMFFNASGSAWAPPAVPSYELSLQASPIQGGNPTSQESTIQQGGATTISANPNEGYVFSHWEIVEGVGSTIDSVTAQTATFTMGSQNAVVRAYYEENQSGEVHVYHTDREGHDLIEPEVLTGTIGEDYQTQPATITNYQIFETPDNASGQFTDETIAVVYVYDIENVTPVDPLDPESEANPENKPELPEDQGLLSIDFVSSFNFGTQTISAQDQTYYAQPQRLMNDDQTVNEDEKRPNYVQVSDRRSDDQATGWQLAVTQETQFATAQNKELTGASLSLSNQQLATPQGGTAPTLQVPDTVDLTPGHKRILLKAGEEEGKGTWIYRFGDRGTLGESVALDIPNGTTADAAAYSTTFTWELSAVPGNK